MNQLVEKSAGELDRRRRFQAQVTVDESVSSRDYKTILNGKNFVSNGINLNRGLYTSRSAIEDILLVGDNQSAVAEVDRTVHQQRENEKKDEAIDRH
ncbi:hypothetical protein F511_28015 [Dorcoceras hygrometricum]|uniref:Uncharacterized protein n=1 Tax=Dorcoceras hygrometricum TaxID=472368 RepID=A0A2Z7BQU8_9LAMI|nr:hypothetical protein F511_28015 [Dorcoceras hygrometricum]